MMLNVVATFSLGLLFQNNMGLVLKKKAHNKMIKFTLLALRLGIVVYIGAIVLPQIKLVVN